MNIVAVRGLIRARVYVYVCMYFFYNIYWHAPLYF